MLKKRKRNRDERLVRFLWDDNPGHGFGASFLIKLRQRRENHEKNIPAEYPLAQSDAWISGTHENEGRPPGAEKTSAKRQKKIVRLMIGHFGDLFFRGKNRPLYLQKIFA